MGLDVIAYKGLKIIDCVFDADREPIDPVTREPLDDCIRLYANPFFQDRALDIESSGVYSYEDAFGGPSMGYGRYNNWREQLAKLAGYAPAPDDERGAGAVRHDMGAWNADGGPFWELIHFSDCEGTIGTSVCQKIAKDFADFQEKASSLEDEAFNSRYSEFRDTFEFASDTGAVVFQ